MNCQIVIQMLGGFVIISMNFVTYSHLLSTYLLSVHYWVPGIVLGEVDTVHGVYKQNKLIV